MQHNRVRRSGLYTSELSLDTMLFGEGQTRSTSKKGAIDTCHAFVAAGGSHIDTPTPSPATKVSALLAKPYKQLAEIR